MYKNKLKNSRVKHFEYGISVYVSLLTALHHCLTYMDANGMKWKYVQGHVTSDYPHSNNKNNFSASLWPENTDVSEWINYGDKKKLSDKPSNFLTIPNQRSTKSMHKVKILGLGQSS